MKIEGGIFERAGLRRAIEDMRRIARDEGVSMEEAWWRIKLTDYITPFAWQKGKKQRARRWPG